MFSLLKGHLQGQRGSQPLLLPRMHCHWPHSWMFLRHWSLQENWYRHDNTESKIIQMYSVEWNLLYVAGNKYHNMLMLTTDDEITGSVIVDDVSNSNKIALVLGRTSCSCRSKWTITDGCFVLHGNMCVLLNKQLLVYEQCMYAFQ